MTEGHIYIYIKIHRIIIQYDPFIRCSQNDKLTTYSLKKQLKEMITTKLRVTVMGRD